MQKKLKALHANKLTLLFKTFSTSSLRDLLINRPTWCIVLFVEHGSFDDPNLK